MDWSDTKFTRAEMACRCGCGLERFHPGFLDALFELRREFAQVMSVTSGCRCRAHNGHEGGHERSLHVGDAPHHEAAQGTLAVDIACPDPYYRGELAAMAWWHGFSYGHRFTRGIIHLDRRDLVGLPQSVFSY